MNSIKECFDIILRGNKNNSRLAARKIRELIYESNGKDRFKDIGKIIETADQEYIKIPENEEWRQENFVIATSVIYFLHNKKEKPDFLFPWFFDLLQHSNGNIRYAAVRMIETEVGPLTVHIRCPEYSKEKSKEERDNLILYSLFMSLERILDYLWKPKYKRYKYVDSLPTSPYKSVQMVLAKLKYSCNFKYLEKAINDIVTRKKWELELETILKK